MRKTKQLRCKPEIQILVNKHVQERKKAQTQLRESLYLQTRIYEYRACACFFFYASVAETLAFKLTMANEYGKSAVITY